MGERTLKGVPGTWGLFALAHAGEQRGTVAVEESLETRWTGWRSAVSGALHGSPAPSSGRARASSGSGLVECHGRAATRGYARVR